MKMQDRFAANRFHDPDGDGVADETGGQNITREKKKEGQMNVYDDYATREELLAALEGAITRRDGADGGSVWRFDGSTRDAMTRRLESASQSAAEERRRREDAETKLRAAERSRDEAASELARLREERGAVAGASAEESRRRFAEQIAALEAQLAPLKEENARYKERETRAAIEAQLVDAARKMDCCESALRDVRRLADSMRLDDAGRAVDRDSRGVDEVLREEIALSPHWLKRSRGGNASPGVDAPSQGSRERFLDALKRGDFADALRFAPKTPVARAL